jgi:antimicrobial peptide system SdpA family protein
MLLLVQRMKKSRKLLLVFAGVCAFWTLLVLYVLALSLPYNPMKFRLPYVTFASKNTLRYLIPEGWGFFTRNPREATYLIFRETNGELKPFVEANASPSRLFGAQRSGRSTMVELGLLIQGLKKKDLVECKKDIRQFVQDTVLVPRNIQNPTPKPFLCGKFWIQLIEPVPWAWSKMAVIMPSKVVYINVVCSYKN